MPRVTANPANTTALVWTNVSNVDTPLKKGTKLQLLPLQPTDEHKTLMNTEGIVSDFYKPFEEDIDYSVHAIVVGRYHRQNYQVRNRNTSYEYNYEFVNLLCKMNGDDDVWNTFLFLDVNVARDKATEAKHQKLLAELPEWAKVKASPTAHPRIYRVTKEHRKFDAPLRKKVDRLFSKTWRELRSIGFDFDPKRGASNHYHKRCIDETILPTIRYFKRSLNVYAQSFIDDCTDDRVYEKDDVWFRGQLGTDAYFEDEKSFVGDKTTIV